VSDSPAILLRRLSRDFGERPALEGVDLELPAGSTLAVLGPNGSGKSTLLRILAGLLRPSGGEAEVLGNELPKEAWRLRGRVGYLGHGPLLYRDLSARENLTLAAELHGLEREAARSRISSLLEAAGMTARADDRVAEYSAGMRQRIDICRAVLHDPALLLLDEPHAHLDVEAQARIEPLLAAGTSRTRVIVSHDRDRARKEADEVLELPPPGPHLHPPAPPGESVMRGSS
jgi:heme exporter protein A